MSGTGLENWQEAGFGIYVHWPFCAAKCPYCDFNSHVRARVEQAQWRDAYVDDVARWAARLPGRVVTSVFFGGGTPSLMPAETVDAILSAIATHWTVANDLEVTLEANPTSVEAARFRDFVGAGVNRFSIGLQALRDADLRQLGRLHSAAEGRRAFDIATGLSARVSFDLIYGRQDQTVDAWRAELGEALTFAGEHLSLYQLTIEPGTAFGDRHARGGLRGLPDEDRSVAMYDVTQALCAEAGLTRYEVSNHAQPNATCRHNLIYWRGGDWVGIGPGAHGRLTIGGQRLETQAVHQPEAWLSSAHDVREQETVLPHQAVTEEYLMMALRLTEGADLDRFRRLGGQLDTARIASHCDAGLLRHEENRVIATDRGILLLNAILGDLLAQPA
ncbi:MAG: radical SAM family heme chaperone HemW [Pseudomonadota bacterium]